MPLPRHAQGMPGTAVIPPDLQATLAPVLTKTRRARVNLRHKRKTQTKELPYATAIPARLQALVRSGRAVGEQEVAGETLHIRGYLVTLDVGFDDADVGDLIDIVSNPDDASFVGRTLLVEGVPRGSVMLERNLFCTMDS